MSASIRQQLHQQIDQLPDHIVEKIANFTQFISTQQNSLTDYIDWQNKEWSEFSLEQFFCEEDEVEYSLEDAQEIYQSWKQVILF